MDPINPIAGNPESLNPNPSYPKNKTSDNHWVTTLSVAFFVMLAIGVIIFLYNQNQTLKKELANLKSPTPTVQETATPTPVAASELPVISSPLANSKVKSPLKVTGSVPPGWMFEGTFPIKLLDSEQKVIAQVGAREVTPGSWQSGEFVEFSANLSFKASSGSGTLVLESDNPSGDPKNLKTFEIPVNF